MTSAFDYFIYLPKCRIVLYKIYYYYIRLDNTRTYLREKYSRLLKVERALIYNKL
jgi:hypothetical protein